jgi:hypothetical protein
VAFEAGADLPLFGAEVDFEHEELVGVGVFAAFEDAGDAEVELGEIVEGNQRFGGSKLFHKSFLTQNPGVTQLWGYRTDGFAGVKSCGGGLF